MRQGKAPTKKQCIFLKSKELEPKEWFIVLDTKEKVVIRNRASNSETTIDKEIAI